MMNGLMHTARIGGLTFFIGNCLMVGNSLARSNLPESLEGYIKSYKDDKNKANTEDLRNILRIYQGNPNNQFYEERFSDNIKFEDPLIMAKGKEEIEEAFRLIKLLNPSKVTYSYFHDGDRCMMVYINVTYVILGQPEDFHSMMYIYYDNEGKIHFMREKWNDVNLFSNFIFRMIRRINGKVSNFLFSYIR